MPLDDFFGMIMGALRALGIILLLPLPAGQTLPAPVRAALSIMLAGALAGIAPMAPLPADWQGMAVAAAHEVLLGLGMGFIGRTVFSAAELAGRLLANEVGVVAAPGFDVPKPDREPLPSLITMLAALLFFTTGAHHGVLAAFARSFDLAPAGAAGFAPDTAANIIEATSRLIELSVRMAAPFIALNFTIILSFAILGRAVPKMNIFVVSFSLRLLFGFGFLASAGGIIAHYMGVAYNDLPWQMLEIVRARVS